MTFATQLSGERLCEPSGINCSVLLSKASGLSSRFRGDSLEGKMKISRTGNYL